MARRDELSEEQWAIIEPLIPRHEQRADGRGRPRIHDDRSVMNGILWVLRTGACWSDLPDRYPSSSTCYRRFSHWVKTGVLKALLEALARDLEHRGGIDLEECFIDGTFIVAKKGGSVLERPSGARVRSSWLLSTLAVYHSACTRLLLHLMKSPLSKLRSIQLSPWDDPDGLSGTRAYDSDPLDARLSEERGVELIAPHRGGRKKKPTQDGRRLRRYRRRWKVERFFAWLNKYKRVITRYNIEHYNAFVHLAAAMILLKRYL